MLVTYKLFFLVNKGPIVHVQRTVENGNRIQAPVTVRADEGTCESDLFPILNSPPFLLSSNKMETIC